MLSYATLPGSTVEISDASHSVYAKALTKYMGVAGLDLFAMLNDVGIQVMESTAGMQLPWTAVSPISGERIYLRLPAGEVPILGRTTPP